MADDARRLGHNAAAPGRAAISGPPCRGPPPRSPPAEAPALHVLARLKGEQFSFRISRELIVYKRRNGSEAQHSVYLASRNHMHTGIHRVQDWLQENLHRRTTLPELAERANMSYRNFCRVFRRETSLTVLEYITLLRKERINELLKQPDLSRQQISQRCGLTSERHLSRMIAQ